MDTIGALQWSETRENVIPRSVYETADAPVLYSKELERIFRGPIWHPVAHRAEFPEPRDFKTAYVGDVPIILSRGKDGQNRAFLNSCAHRGTLLESRFRGKSSAFQCPYHRWTYDLKGCLIACPGQEDFPDYFRREDFGLKEVRVAEHAGLVFVTLHPDTPPLLDYLGPVANVLTKALGGDGRLRLLGYQKVAYRCNWKVYIDQDGYHGPLLHLAFRLLGLQGGTSKTSITDQGHLTVAYDTVPYKDNGFLKDPTLLEARGKNRSGGGHVITLFPTTLVTDHLDVINPRFARPLGPDQMEVHYVYLGREDDEPDYLRHRIRQGANLLGPCGLITFDDATAFLRIQRAARAGVPNTFLKGVRQGLDPHEPPQLGELANVLWWKVYRRYMDL